MKLATNTLYILSGVPGSGKSTLTKQVPQEMVISSDRIRENLIGTLFSFNKKAEKRRSSDRDKEVFEIVDKMLEARLKERLTTFLDATNVSDKVRSKYVKMAKENNMKAEILIFTDVEKALVLNKKRDHVVPDESMERMIEKFQPTSMFPFREVSSKDKIKFQFNEIDEDIGLDAIGDIHGLFDECIALMRKLGYDENGNHPKGRKLIFLGDFVDRGPKSVEMIRLVKRLVANGHFAIIGNHEEKLILNALKYSKGEQPKGSFAVLQTFVAIVKEKDYEELIAFIKTLPAYYIHGKYAFVHGDITYFNPLETPYSELIYGTYKDYSKRDADEEYEELYKDKINKYILIRGHVEGKNKYKYVYSLENDQAFAGHIMALSMDKIKNNNFKDATIKHKSEFDFGKVKKTNQIFNKLIKDGFVMTKEYPLFTVFKYTKKVFFDNLWSESELILKARGIILDFAGNVIVHPFDKVFNYLENGSGRDIPDDEIVIYVEKFNGFLGNISLDPYTKKLIYSTTGSLDSDFAKMIEEMVDRKTVGMLYKFFSKNDVTLSFEVIHPNDPHIISYDESEHGLKLIGARTKGFNDKSMTEEALDVIAEELRFARPEYGRISFGELKNLVRKSDLEGYMVRKDNEEQDFILKFKTPYYLVTKFLGRLSVKNTRFMFANPNKFKETIDEEFYGIVDLLINSISQREFEYMTNEDKVVMVRNLIDKERS